MYELAPYRAEVPIPFSGLTHTHPWGSTPRSFFTSSEMPPSKLINLLAALTVSVDRGKQFNFMNGLHIERQTRRMDKLTMTEHPSITDELKQNCPNLCIATIEVTYMTGRDKSANLSKSLTQWSQTQTKRKRPLLLLMACPISQLISLCPVKYFQN